MLRELDFHHEKYMGSDLVKCFSLDYCRDQASPFHHKHLGSDLVEGLSLDWCGGQVPPFCYWFWAFSGLLVARFAAENSGEFAFTSRMCGEGHFSGRSVPSPFPCVAVSFAAG